MNEFWNNRYAAAEYAYGTSPNHFFREQIDKLEPGAILLPAEGEGRNAVYAAMNGWEVYAFDFSPRARLKAEKLAAANHVQLNYLTASFDEIEYPENSFDCIALVYVHFHPSVRTMYHKKILNFLKPGGIIILEGFSKKQIRNSSGGPKDMEMLFSAEELKADFEIMHKVEVNETTISLKEGIYHQGTAEVIRMRGVR